jgi:hypothetical protein
MTYVICSGVVACGGAFVPFGGIENREVQKSKHKRLLDGLFHIFMAQLDELILYHLYRGLEVLRRLAAGV